MVREIDLNGRFQTRFMTWLAFFPTKNGREHQYHEMGLEPPLYNCLTPPMKIKMFVLVSSLWAQYSKENVLYEQTMSLGIWCWNSLVFHEFEYIESDIQTVTPQIILSSLTRYDQRHLVSHPISGRAARAPEERT